MQKLHKTIMKMVHMTLCVKNKKKILAKSDLYGSLNTVNG